MWLAQTQTLALVSTIVTVLGTVLVSQVAGAPVQLSNVVFTTTASGLSGVTAVPVWVGNTVSVTVSGSFQVSGIVPTTTASGGSGLTALPVWLLNAGITIRQSAQTPVNIAGTLVLAAAASSSAGPIPFTINVGTTAATVTSAWSCSGHQFPALRRQHFCHRGRRDDADGGIFPGGIFERRHDREARQRRLFSAPSRNS